MHVEGGDAEINFVDVGVGSSRVGDKTGVVATAWKGPVPPLQCLSVKYGEDKMENGKDDGKGFANGLLGRFIAADELMVRHMDESCAEGDAGDPICLNVRLVTPKAGMEGGLLAYAVKFVIS